MFSAITDAFREAFRNLRSNFFQTFLSVLGIIIGVAALVAMLSMIDGLETMAREQLSARTSVETVMIQRNTDKRVDGLYVPMEKTIRLTRPLIDSLLTALPYPAVYQLYTDDNALISIQDTGEVALRYQAISLPAAEKIPAVTAGRMLEAADGTDARPVTMINHSLAERMVGKDGPTENALGKKITLYGIDYEVIGIQEAEVFESYLGAILPLATLLNSDSIPAYSLNAMINFERVEDVKPGQEFIDTWFADRYPDIESPVKTSAQLDRVADMETSFLIFRLVMSFLIGIAVIVGGVGVMNVLLMSVTERTTEIGIRKAVGANRRRIITQFLSESVAIATIGSVLGTLLGIAIASIAAPLITYLADGPEFIAVFSLQTLLIVAVLAILTGVIFGTYPARRAAGLDPVVAIQRA